MDGSVRQAGALSAEQPRAAGKPHSAPNGATATLAAPANARIGAAGDRGGGPCSPGSVGTLAPPYSNRVPAGS